MNQHNTVALFSKTKFINEVTFMNDTPLKRRHLLLNDVRNGDTHYYVFIQTDVAEDGHTARQFSVSRPINNPTPFNINNVSFCGDVAMEDVELFIELANEIVESRQKV